MRNLRIVPVVILSTTLAAACGGGSSSNNNSGGTPTTPTTPTTPQNRAPVINSMSITPFGIGALSTFTYSASASDPDGDPVSYAWDLAGNPASGSSGTMLFTAAGGSGTARLTVTDGRGGTTTDTRSFIVGSMTGAWQITSGPLAGASFNLTQSSTGLVTGTFSLPGIGNGNTDPAQPGRIDVNGALTMRVKVGPFTDFNMNGTMTQTGRTVSGSLQGSGFTGQPFSMSK